MASAVVLGLAYESPVVDFPVRTGPGTNFDKAAFTAAKGTANCQILDVQPDSQGETSNFGRVYQWFQLKFPDGNTGWMRGHVVGLTGDCTQWGYGTLAEPTHAYTLIRQEVVATPEPAQEMASDPKKGAAPMAETPDKGGTAEASIFGDAKAQDSTGGGEQKPDKPATETIDPTATGMVTGTTKPTTPPKATIKTQSGANTRVGPGLSFDRGTPIPRDAKVDLLEVKLEAGGQNYRWFKFNYNGNQGWIREDLVTWEGDTEALGFAWDTYPAPMGDNRWWVRGWNFGSDYNPNIFKHDGWDLGAQQGEPVYGGPYGGKVINIHKCTKCTADRPSALQQGHTLGDSAVWNDPEWGWGYGNFIIVRYHNDLLPESTKQKMTKLGFNGGHAFVMYAHMHEMSVSNGEDLKPGQVIGSCGNTGNSEAPHVHLEVRLGNDANTTSWSTLADNRVNPIILFKR